MPNTHPRQSIFIFRDDHKKKITWTSRILIEEMTIIPWSIRTLRWGIILAFVGLSTMVAMLCTISAPPPLQMNITITLGWISCGLLFLAVGLLLYPLFTDGLMRGFRDYYLSRSQCPACLTSLRGQPLEEDDCVVCPECRAAWKITDKVAQP